MGGIMVSEEVYASLMKVENAGRGDMIVDKIMLNVYDDSEEAVKRTMELIKSRFTDRDFLIDDAVSKINMVKEGMQDTNRTIELIFLFAVIVSIFGLISSMYAIILERKFEIAILRSMGLKARDVRRIFFVESMIVLFSAGITGTIIGTWCAYLLISNIAMLLEIPIVYTIPRETFVRIYFLSVMVATIGMRLITKKVSRQFIMDIFREAF